MILSLPGFSQFTFELVSRFTTDTLRLLLKSWLELLPSHLEVFDVILPFLM